MKYKPFNSKYDYKDAVLIKDYPDYFHDPISDWIFDVAEADCLYVGSHFPDVYYLYDEFGNNLQRKFREKFPREWSEFVEYVLFDPDRTTEILALCLQNYAKIDEADKLEDILNEGGSAYCVVKTDDDAADYEKGVYDIEYRVSEIVKEQSLETLEKNKLVKDAWKSCFARKPDYEGVASKCNDFSEGYFRDKYWPEKKRTYSIYQCIEKFKKKPDMLEFIGDGFFKNKTHLIELLNGISNVRGEHSTGTGREPTQEEAEYILHTTIYIWNLIERKK